MNKHFFFGKLCLLGLQHGCHDTVLAIEAGILYSALNTVEMVIWGLVVNPDGLFCVLVRVL